MKTLLLMIVLCPVWICSLARADEPIIKDSIASDTSPDVGSTKGLIDFQRPEEAVQLVGDSGSQFVPESHYECQWTFDSGVVTASPTWDRVVTPDAYEDFRMHVEINVNEANDDNREKNGNSGVYIQQRY